MRYLFLGGLLACLLATAPALADYSPCNDHKTTFKSDSHVLARPVSDRQGGDTIDTATVIDAIPFTDTGATCDNVNDYDEACPYPDSVAPDVVYSYTPPQDLMVTIDLAGSAYDTKIYVYDENLELVACNDDFHADYTSRIDRVALASRFTYYIVVDGYGEDCGAYVLELREHIPCELICPAGAFIEGEPPLAHDYIDEFNGGCCGSENNELQILAGRANGSQVLCGRSGFFTVGGAQTRDTDWFVVTIGVSGVITVRGDAEEPTYLFELGPLDCNSVGVLQNVVVGPCAEGSLTITGEPFSEVWVWMGPTAFTAPDGSDLYAFDYTLWFDGLAPGGITGVPDGPEVISRSLSTVKGLFE